VRLLERFRSKRVIVETVEVALESKVVLRPDSFQRPNKFLGTAITLVMVEPWFADGPELTTEPATDDIDRGAAARQLVQGGELLRGNRRIPRSGSRATISLSRSVAANNA
jgi:hypothetical protein